VNSLQSQTVIGAFQSVNSTQICFCPSGTTIRILAGMNVPSLNAVIHRCAGIQHVWNCADPARLRLSKYVMYLRPCNLRSLTALIQGCGHCRWWNTCETFFMVLSIAGLCYLGHWMCPGQCPDPPCHFNVWGVYLKPAIYPHPIGEVFGGVEKQSHGFSMFGERNAEFRWSKQSSHTCATQH
jgi:hypothetical protein